MLAISALLATVGVFWIGEASTVDGRLRCGNPLRVPAQTRSDPVRVLAQVVHVEGLGKRVHKGDRCEMFVYAHTMPDGALQCHSSVRCAQATVYGGPDLGYFPCAVYDEPRKHVVGSDPDTTARDHDGAMQLDTPSGVLRVWDDLRGPFGAFELEAEIIEVR